jgi:hypothetical protein
MAHAARRRKRGAATNCHASAAATGRISFPAFFLTAGFVLVQLESFLPDQIVISTQIHRRGRA